MSFSLYLPFPASTITQPFGANDNPLYASQGLKGHTAPDFDVPWGSPIRACEDGLIYSVMNKDNPDPTRYRAVYQLVQDGEVFYELCYGHMNDIYVRPGQRVMAGDIIGTVGNTGPVYHDGAPVSKEARLAGSHQGAHLHGPQVRPCRRVKVSSPTGQLLSDGFGVYRDAEGHYFEVLNYQNGYNGCVAPVFNGKLAESAPALRSFYTQLASLYARLMAQLKNRPAPPASTQIS
jgi:murein DD-endopeptidase MepM/ murein hydrolase activator NlpD